MKLTHILAASTAALTLGACGDGTASIKEVDSCSSDLLEGSVSIRERGMSLSISLVDNAKHIPTDSGYLNEHYYREHLVPEDEIESQSQTLTSQMNAFCRTGDIPANEGIRFERETLEEYICVGDSSNRARIEFTGKGVALLTGNINLSQDKVPEITWDTADGYTSIKLNVYPYDEARELARAHCQAPSITPESP